MPHATSLCLLALLAQQTPPLPAPPLQARPPAIEDLPATQPTLEQLRAEHKHLVDQEFSSLPVQPARPIKQIVSVSVEDHHLHVKPLLDTTAGSVAIDATDWPGRMHVAVGAPNTLMFHLKHIDLSRKDAIATYTQIITGVDYLQISRDSENEHGLASVTLIQSRQFADENDDPIRITVRQMPDDENAGPGVNILLAGASFEALRRDHPAEMRKYLLPILADLRAAGLLRASDARTAWQVLGTEVQVDPKLQEKVQALVKKLDAADFAARVAAEEELTSLGAPAAVVLARMDIGSLPPDPRATVETVIRSNQTLPADRVASLRKDTSFLLDTLLLDDDALRKAAASRLGDLCGKRVDMPDNLKPEEREQRVETLRQELAPATQPAKP